MKDIADYAAEYENKDTIISVNNHSIVFDTRDRQKNNSELDTIKNKR